MKPENPFKNIHITKNVPISNLIIEYNSDENVNYICKRTFRNLFDAIQNHLDESFLNSKTFKDALWKICKYEESLDREDKIHDLLYNWAEVNLPSDLYKKYFFERMCDIEKLHKKEISKLKIADLIRNVIKESKNCCV